MKRTLLLIPILIFFSCANPNGTKALVAAANGGLAYAGGNETGAIIDAVSAAAYGIQALQGTPSAADPTAITSTATSYGLSAADATTIATAVTTLVNKGQAPSAANEAVAMQLYAAATSATTAAQGPKGNKGLHCRWETDGWVVFNKK